MTQAWPTRTLKSPWPQGLGQGWSCDLSWANENASGYLRSLRNPVVQEQPCDSGLPRTTLNHCGYRDWVKGGTWPKINQWKLPTFAGKVWKGMLSFPHGSWADGVADLGNWARERAPNVEAHTEESRVQTWKETPEDSHNLSNWSSHAGSCTPPESFNSLSQQRPFLA